MLDHLPDGNFLLQFGDRSGEDIIHCRFIRGIIQEDECLEILHQEGFQYPRALVKMVDILQKKSAEVKLQLENAMSSNDLASSTSGNSRVKAKRRAR